MGLTPPDPYAPPSALPSSPEWREMPLPAGVRRFRLDPERYGRLQRRRALTLVGVVVPMLAIVMLPPLLAARGTIGLLSLLPGALVSIVFVLGAAARARGPVMATYELLLGARVVRRTLAGLQPAEVLRPEVTSIVETADGLFVCCAGPRRALFVTRAVDGYDDVRAEIGTWRPVDTLRGWQGWRRGMRESGRQGLRDAVMGTALGSDPSLAAELETIRSASNPGWQSYGAAPRRSRMLRIVLLWVLLVTTFLAIWQFLQPSPP